MINHIRLTNFKVFKDLQIQLRALTLLTGLNGSGKSTVIQSLLLLRQSYLANHQKSDMPLMLNGDYLRIGQWVDVHHRSQDETTSSNLAFEVRLTSSTLTWEYTQGEDVNSDQHKYIYLVDHSISPPSDRPHEMTPLLRSAPEKSTSEVFHYLHAERLGPRLTSAAPDHEVVALRQLGLHGEYTAHFLNVFFDDKVLRDLHHPKSSGSTLGEQVRVWMSEISPGVKLYPEPLADTDMLRLRFGFGLETFRATNVGFGLSYILPVVVALLSAGAGSLVILENPEAHLHPRGQSQIGRLIALAANAGVQVIVETHSDHVLNGIRMAVYDSDVSADKVIFHYFERSERGASQVTPLTLNDKARFTTEPPEGFFDEYHNNLLHLL